MNTKKSSYMFLNSNIFPITVIYYILFLFIILTFFPSCTYLIKDIPYFSNYNPGNNEFKELEYLKNKTIIIDPGHGGVFPGAISKEKLMEKDINLSVALHLYGMLKNSGADVLMTRYSDIEFSQNISDDLKNRVLLLNDINSDLLISIHHNSSVNRKSKYSEIYYKGIDNIEPSEQIAGILLKHLKKDTAINEGKIIKSNFFILRNSDCPAILIETTFLSNKKVARKLQSIEASKIEALAIFKGIKEYFSNNIPVITYKDSNSEQSLNHSNEKTKPEGLPYEHEKIVSLNFNNSLNKTEYKTNFSSITLLINLKDILNNLEFKSLSVNLINSDADELNPGNSISLKLNDYVLYRDSGIFNLICQDLPGNGDYLIYSSCKNNNSFSSKTIKHKITVNKPPKTIIFYDSMKDYPKKSNIKLPVYIKLLDVDDIPIKEKITSYFFSKDITFVKDKVKLEDYKIINYFYAPEKKISNANFTVKAANIIKNFNIYFSTTNLYLITETFSEGSKKELPGCSINISTGIYMKNDSLGYSLIDITKIQEDSLLTFFKKGYNPVLFPLNKYLQEAPVPANTNSTSMHEQNSQVIYKKIFLTPSVSENIINKKIAFYIDLDTKTADIENKISVLQKEMADTGIKSLFIFKEKDEDIFNIICRVEKFSPDLGILLSFDKEYENKKIKNPLLGYYFSSTKGKKIVSLISDQFQNSKSQKMTDYLITQSSCPFIYLNPVNIEIPDLVKILSNAFAKYFSA